MYALKQAGQLANDHLQIHLAKSDYIRAGITPGLFHHITKKIVFSRVIDDFGVKWEDRADLDHLITCLRKLYEVDVKIEDNLYIGITLDWRYEDGYVDLSMPGYIEKVLKRFDIAEVLRPVLAPHAWNAPMYGQKAQLTNPADTTAALLPAQKTRLQEIVGTLQIERKPQL